MNVPNTVIAIFNVHASADADAILKGRAQAVEEMADLVSRLARRFEPENEPHITMRTLVHNWLEIVAWLNQAEAEVTDERALLKGAHAEQAAGSPD
jgi:hypothetical protein